MADPIKTPEQIAQEAAFAQKYGVKPAVKPPPPAAAAPVDTTKQNFLSRILRDRERAAGTQ